MSNPNDRDLHEIDVDRVCVHDLSEHHENGPRGYGLREDVESDPSDLNDRGQCGESVSDPSDHGHRENVHDAHGQKQ